MKANYHTHTKFCGHASGKSWDYIKEAIDKDFEVIGISDHAPNNRVNDHNVRMKQEQFLEYIADIDQAKVLAQGKIKVYKGIEVEFFHDHEQYYEDLHNHLDYMIHGQHYISMTNEMHNLISGFALSTKEEIFKYSEYLVAAMESKHFDFLAHPDLYMCGYKDFDEHAEAVAHTICRKAVETNTILEFNANGFRRGVQKTPQGFLQPYPRPEFWKIVKSYGIKTILSSDCHNPKLLYDMGIREAEEEYKNLDLIEVTFLDLD